jgi:hypothetical protein
VSQANAKTETEQATSLVVGGTGLVGGYIVGISCAAASGRLPYQERSRADPASVGFVEIWKSRTH